VKTTKQQTRAVYDCSVAGQSPWAQASPTDYRLYGRYVTQQHHCSCSCSLSNYTSVICLRCRISQTSVSISLQFLQSCHLSNRDHRSTMVCHGCIYLRFKPRELSAASDVVECEDIMRTILEVFHSIQHFSKTLIARD